ncbi:MAG: hypothetical protein P1V97_11330, partial [Planctomycetota bacterium]|nr:hypothetical protein [Planctomycetota bacterium]
QLVSFKSLQTPVLCASSGLFDGLNATFWLDSHLSGSHPGKTIPGWNYEYLVTLTVLSIPMTLLMCAGFLKGLQGCWKEELGPRHLIVLSVTVFLAVLVWHSLNHPFYCHRKATYALGVLPAFACLIGMGFELLPDRFAIRSITIGYMASWCIIVFIAFFVRA